MEKKLTAKIIGHISAVVLMLLGGYILFFHGYKHPDVFLFGWLSCLGGLVLAWAVSDKEKKKLARTAVIYIAILISMIIILSLIHT